MDYSALLERHGISVVTSIALAWAVMRAAQWIAERIDSSAQWTAENVCAVAQWCAPLGVRMVEATESNARAAASTLAMLQTMDQTVRWNHEQIVELTHVVQRRSDEHGDRLDELEQRIEPSTAAKPVNLHSDRRVQGT